MNYVVLGASAAGINAIKVLRELDEKANITLISKDEHIYSRCMLHHIISEHRTLDSLNFVETKFDEIVHYIILKSRWVLSLCVQRYHFYMFTENEFVSLAPISPRPLAIRVHPFKPEFSASMNPVTTEALLVSSGQKNCWTVS